MAATGFWNVAQVAKITPTIKSLTHRIHVWYIYLHLFLIYIFLVNVGKYTVRPMEHLGYRYFLAKGKKDTPNPTSSVPPRNTLLSKLPSREVAGEANFDSILAVAQRFFFRIFVWVSKIKNAPQNEGFFWGRNRISYRKCWFCVLCRCFNIFWMFTLH